MALIKCPECGKEISSLAKSCPNCGCPIETINPKGIVKIKIPNIDMGDIGMFSSHEALIRGENGVVIWKGYHGQTANFEVEKPTFITIDLGKWVQTFNGIVEPKKKYTCVPDLGFHLVKMVYRLTEVDVIDAD